MNPIDLEQTLSLIAQRRSIRRFQPRPVEPALIEKLLTAAHWAPSAHNRQPWRFVVVLDEHNKRSLADQMAERLAADLRASGVDEEAIAADTGRSRQRLTGAPVLILTCFTLRDMDVYPDARRQSLERTMAIQSAAMAAQNLLLAAHAAGLGACWLCAPLFCPDVVREALDLPGDLEPQGAIILGYPAEERSRTREPLETRVNYR
jgi:coenzyme F420-0:L-glutamate ligase/coenzyme F420-1:gamma-L-glutamate ligase